MQRFGKISFKNKILLSTLLVIVLLGVGVFFAIQWVLLPSLISQLKLRGLGIAQSIADNSKAYILTENIPELTSLLFDTTQLKERKPLIAYVFITDTENKVVSHTFTYPFPEALARANPISSQQSYHIKQIPLHDGFAYDIAVPIQEGIYQVGTVHVGLNKEHIDQLIEKLFFALFGIIAAIIVVGFIISDFLSNYVTRPLLHLSEVADKIGSGNLDVRANLSNEIVCWEITGCEQPNCPAHGSRDIPCWYVDGTLCMTQSMTGRYSNTSYLSDPHLNSHSLKNPIRDERGKTHLDRSTDPWVNRRPAHPVLPTGEFPEKLESCRRCHVYANCRGDEISQLAASFNNMTFRLKQSKVKLKDSEEKYRFLFDYDPNSIFVLDPESLLIMDVNAWALKIYGHQKEELLGTSFLHLGPCEYTEGLLSWNGRNDDTQRSIYTKVEHHTKDKLPFYVNIYAFRTGQADRANLILTTIDITESLAKEAQLIHASKMSTLGEMASGVPHEINQPLSTIQIGADFIKNAVSHTKEVPHSDLKQVVQHMIEQVDRAVRIINHLRAFGRKTEITKEKVHINEPIAGVFTLLGEQLNLRGIDVVLDLDKDLPPIAGDAIRLEQVFVDLVINARDSLEQKQARFVTGSVETRLGIKSFEENGNVVITVWDTGMGISKAIIERIFEPFFTTKEVDRGTGLGLSISYGIVKDYGGHIEVESEEGKDATFKITFPAWREVRNEH